MSQLDTLIAPEIINDELAVLLGALAARPDVRNILEIGSSSGGGSTAALIHNMGAGKELFCIELSKVRADALAAGFASFPQLHAINASSVPADKFMTLEAVTLFYGSHRTGLNNYPLVQVLGWLAQDMDYLSQHIDVPQNGIELAARMILPDLNFDLVLIDGSAFTAQAELDLVYGAKIIALDDINDIKNFHNHRRLLGDPKYQLIAHNPALRNGYAVFEMST